MNQPDRIRAVAELVESLESAGYVVDSEMDLDLHPYDHCTVLFEVSIPDERGD